MADDKITDICDRINIRTDCEQHYLHDRLYTYLQNRVVGRAVQYSHVIEPGQDQNISIFFKHFDDIVIQQTNT